MKDNMLEFSESMSQFMDIKKEFYHGKRDYYFELLYGITDSVSCFAFVRKSSGNWTMNGDLDDFVKDNFTTFFKDNNLNTFDKNIFIDQFINKLSVEYECHGPLFA